MQKNIQSTNGRSLQIRFFNESSLKLKIIQMSFLRGFKLKIEVDIIKSAMIFRSVNIVQHSLLIPKPDTVKHFSDTLDKLHYS